MPQDNSKRDYTRCQAERYVQLLGCWGFANPTDAAKRRSPVEYKKFLLQLIEVNKNRTDKVGVWEIEAAKIELSKLY